MTKLELNRINVLHMNFYSRYSHSENPYRVLETDTYYILKEIGYSDANTEKFTDFKDLVHHLTFYFRWQDKVEVTELELDNLTLMTRTYDRIKVREVADRYTLEINGEIVAVNMERTLLLGVIDTMVNGTAVAYIIPPCLLKKRD